MYENKHNASLNDDKITAVVCLLALGACIHDTPEQPLAGFVSSLVGVMTLIPTTSPSKLYNGKYKMWSLILMYKSYCAKADNGTFYIKKKGNHKI